MIVHSLTALLAGFAANLLPVSGLVATEVLRSGDIITEDNASLEPGGDYEDATSLLGREVKRTVYQGQPIKPENTRSRRLVRRNQVVSVVYVSGPLEITMTGRALGEAGVGDTVEVMNADSRKVITGTVTPEGWIRTQ